MNSLFTTGVNMDKLENADFNILNLTKEKLQFLRPVKVLDIYENNTENFHEDGLFSVATFGRVGSPERDQRFSYIDTKIDVLHPLIFRNVIKLKQFYGDIIKGSAYAIFDESLKDFVKADPITGETGYNFFLTHWESINFEKNDSVSRNARIKFIDKYRKVAKTNKILVLPAGLRDIQHSEDGQDKEGEINEFYRRIISIANTLSSMTNVNSSITDASRLGIQNAFNSIYSYIISLMRGKGGFILKKWAKRRIFNSTRAVLTGQTVTVNKLSDVTYPTWNNSVIGLAQLMKALLPVAVHKLLNFELVTESFPTNDNTALLVNPKTLVREQVKIQNKSVDKWTTQNGVESLFQNFMEHSVRGSVVTIDGYYLGLIYRGSNQTFKILYDINDAKQYPWMDVKNVYPITWVELFYIMGYKDWNKYPMLSTRYPISGSGSIFPAYVYCKPTVVTEIRYEADEYGNPILENRAISFPVLENAVFVDSIAVDHSRLAGLNADFDGDTVSGIALYTEDAIKEIDSYLKSPEAYLKPGGGILNNPYTDPIQRVIFNMTGD